MTKRQTDHSYENQPVVAGKHKLSIDEIDDLARQAVLDKMKVILSAVSAKPGASVDTIHRYFTLYPEEQPDHIRQMVATMIRLKLLETSGSGFVRGELANLLLPQEPVI